LRDRLLIIDIGRGWIGKMTTTELREEAIHRIKALPVGKLKVASEFLAFLDEFAGDEATRELLRIPGVLRDIRMAKTQIASGKGKNWREIRRDDAVRMVGE
jgi:hypothetical protein